MRKDEKSRDSMVVEVSLQNINSTFIHSVWCRKPSDFFFISMCICCSTHSRALSVHNHKIINLRSGFSIFSVNVDLLLLFCSCAKLQARFVCRRFYPCVVYWLLLLLLFFDHSAQPNQNKQSASEFIVALSYVIVCILNF